MSLSRVVPAGVPFVVQNFDAMDAVEGRERRTGSPTGKGKQGEVEPIHADRFERPQPE